MLINITETDYNTIMSCLRERANGIVKETSKTELHKFVANELANKLKAQIEEE